MTRKAKLCIASLTVLMLTLLAESCLPETLAIAWHVRHGFHAEISNIVVEVPLLYSVTADRESLMLWNMSGKLRYLWMRSPHAAIMSFHRVTRSPATQPLNAAVQRMGDIWLRHGYSQTGQRSVSLANDAGKCLEYAGPSALPSLPRYGNKQIQIYCAFGEDMVVDFSGTPNTVGNFYALIKSAKPAKGEN